MNSFKVARLKSFVRWSAALWLLCGFHLIAQDAKLAADLISGIPVADLPQVRSPFTLLAVTDPETGKSAFSFAGQEVPPVIRTWPGEDTAS